MTSPDKNIKFSLGTSVILGPLMILLALLRVLCNTFVIIGFMVDKELRHRSNYFFLSLAISDFLVGK
uniref:G-protein coupled receptors family 1 profile domain-containing protein n=1 Tax=Ornithorhynchus anatinus TaxID=9258 RepID=A0A6I8NYC8_ORNAN